LAFIPATNGLFLCFDFSQNGQQWQFCLGFRKVAGSITTGDLGDVAAAAAGWWTAHFKARLDDSVTLVKTVATDQTYEGAPSSEVLVGTAGTLGGGTEPINAALVMSFRTLLRGRSFRGRAYISGATTGVVVTGVDFDATWVSDVANDFVTLAGLISALGFDQVVISRYHALAPRVTAVMTVVDSIVTDTVINSQRRRLAGRGT